MPDKNFLSESEAAELLPFSRQTLMNKRHRGDGPPYYEIDSRYYYRAEEVEEWLENQKKSGNSDE